MLKVVCIKSCDKGIMYGDGAVEKDELYYAHKWDELYLLIYNFETTDYIGCFLPELFGSFKLWTAINRDKIIEEIFKD